MMKKTLLVAVALIALVGCTENVRTRQWGGSQTINLPPGQKLEMATFKTGADLWLLYRPMRTNEIPETHFFKEKSNWGMMEGTVTIVETR
jgi:hypothetical protein